MNTDLITFRGKHVCHYVGIEQYYKARLIWKKKKVGTATTEIDFFNQ